MDKKYDISLPRPRKPAKPVSPFYPPVPSKPQVININIDDDNDLMNLTILSSLNAFNSRLLAVEEIINTTDFGQLELGEISGTAYPGDKGYSNATAITLISQQLQNLITRSEFNDVITDFATIGAVNEMLANINQTIDEKLSGNIDNENVSAVVSAIASTVINNYHSEESEDYTDILNNTNSLLNELGD